LSASDTTGSRTRTKGFRPRQGSQKQREPTYP
jgi:hypothetical protein